MTGVESGGDHYATTQEKHSHGTKHGHGHRGKDTGCVRHKQPSLPSANISAFDDVLPEPADPVEPNHQQRLQTRIAPPDYDDQQLPKVLVECGCGDCPVAVDPLADDTDTEQWAKHDCPNPQPMTLKRATESHLTYQKKDHNTEGETSNLQTLRSKTCPQIYDSERAIMDQWGDSLTTVLFSFRVSPIEYVSVATDGGGGTAESDLDNYATNREKQSHCDKPHQQSLCDPTKNVPSDTETEHHRRWIEPVRLAERVADGFESAMGVLEYRLGKKAGLEYEYFWITGYTDSCATPHRHLLVYVDDPADTVSTDHVEPVVESFTRNATGAYSHDHPVGEDSASDAVVIEHDPTKGDITDDTAVDVYKHIDAREDGETTVSPPTAALQYLVGQHPDWVLSNVYDANSDVHADSTAVQGAAIAMAASRDRYGSSEGFSPTR